MEDGEEVVSLQESLDSEENINWLWDWEQAISWLSFFFIDVHNIWLIPINALINQINEIMREYSRMLSNQRNSPIMLSIISLALAGNLYELKIT